MTEARTARPGLSFFYFGIHQRARQRSHNLEKLTVGKSHNSSAPPVQARSGNAAVCASCGQTLNPKRHSHRQRWCSEQCRDETRRRENFASMGRTQTKPGSTQNLPAFSVACEGENRGRGSAGNVLVAIGSGASPQVPIPTDLSIRSELIKRAIAAELSARWPTFAHRTAITRPVVGTSRKRVS
jgi:hypothetical protein